MRQVTYHVEAWSSCLPEMSLHWPNHWREVGLYQDEIPLDPDYDEYARLERAGAVHVSVARHQGQFVGYAVVILRRHLHYRESLTAIYDLYYMRPTFRQGWAGIGLFKHVERNMRARGVQRILLATKVAHDYSKIFKRLGYDECERAFSKLLSPVK